ncbi:RNA 2',3'-cyclic phosphodiesterase [Actinomadura sp. HBU206391]|uniref:RNA 2',3'-cyclic phosphodiesterase n=1 Tax=Actinomadura sp. HBU206391 TaxID=2731692 RepID=UPI00165044B7|nr:RNA 2',3'-cyclic phosphodiesterase [Actinomadura sp. HBU206391]MBC6460308.1 RNA 2',3'-cyclic phosphodiesterase [Actinomadura sp. HBU206391]
MRLFVALPLPPRVLDEIEEFIAPLRTGWPDLKWLRRDLMHVTLTFLGEVDDRTLDWLPPRLERAARRYDPLTLSLAGAGAFPGGGAHARVLWTGLYGDRRTLVRLAASVAAAGTRAGSPFGEHRAFRPHLTLARCRRPTDVRPLLDDLSAFAGSPWTADSICLVRSHLGGQVRHETLKTWSLGRPGTPAVPS